jgi:hypothetical protein
MFHVEHSHTFHANKKTVPRGNNTHFFLGEMMCAKSQKCSTWNTPFLDCFAPIIAEYVPLKRAAPRGNLVLNSTSVRWTRVTSHYARRTPIANTLECDCGTINGRVQSMVWASFGRVRSWPAPISRAMPAPGARNRMAKGRALSKRSTALRVTMSAWGGFGLRRVSARSDITFTSINVRDRAASRRKAAFL